MTDRTTERTCCTDPRPDCRCDVTPLRDTGVYRFQGSTGAPVTLVCKKRLRMTTRDVTAKEIAHD